MPDDAGTLLRSFLNNALRTQTQRRIRDFGGYEIGKRRRPDFIDAIADEVAEFLCTYLDIKAHGRSAKREALILGVRADHCLSESVLDSQISRFVIHDGCWNGGQHP